MKIYHWLLPALSLFPVSAAAQMAGYEYWTDGNDTQRTYVEQTQGSVGIEIDVADLRPGIHRFHFRACDAQGRWSSPFAVISSVWEKRMTAPAWPHANMP